MAAENVNLVTRAFHFKGAPLYDENNVSNYKDSNTGYRHLINNDSYKSLKINENNCHYYLLSFNDLNF